MPLTGLFGPEDFGNPAHAKNPAVSRGPAKDKFTTLHTPSLEWTPEVEQKLHAGVGEILELDDEARQNCELIHFEMDEGDANNQRRMHYLVVYHPGKMKLLRQMKDRRRDLLVFTPALEATLVYDPAANKVHVLSDKRGTAQRLANHFGDIGAICPTR